MDYTKNAIAIDFKDLVYNMDKKHIIDSKSLLRIITIRPDYEFIGKILNENRNDKIIIINDYNIDILLIKTWMSFHRTNINYHNIISTTSEEYEKSYKNIRRISNENLSSQ